MGPLEKLSKSLAKLPGLGRKSAARLAFHLLKTDRTYLSDLGHQIATIRDRLILCSECGNYTEISPCELCADTTRDRSVLCVVEQVQDLMNLHSTGEYKGLFFVLHGVLAPIDGIGPNELGLDRLTSRVKDLGIEEVILATNPTVEGDTTALYIRKLITSLNVRVTRLASGLPVGGDLEYADRLTIARAINARTEMA